jgi:hypothetical protein
MANFGLDDLGSFRRVSKVLRESDGDPVGIATLRARSALRPQSPLASGLREENSELYAPRVGRTPRGEAGHPEHIMVATASRFAQFAGLRVPLSAISIVDIERRRPIKPV